MRLVYLAILFTFLCTCRSERKAKQRANVHALQANVPDTVPPEDTVNGPIKAQGVDPTEDMESKDASSPAGITPENDKSSAVLTDDGDADEVEPAELLTEKVEGVWDFKDLFIFHPTCANCKAVMDYKWILNEYGSNYVVRPLLVMAMFVFIWLLGTTARDFFVPPLLYWSERLQLSPEMAVATLLAFGNCAPDVFSVITAAHKDDLPLAVSEMLGSNMFGLCITGSLVTLSCWHFKESQIANGTASNKVASSSFPMATKSLVLTVCFYLVMMAALTYVLMQGHPTLLKTCALPLIYVLYVFMLCKFGPEKEMESMDASLASPEGGTGDVFASTEGGTGDSLSPTDEPPSLEGIAMPKDGGPLEIAWWWLVLPAYIMRYACIPAVDGHWGPIRRATSAFTPLGMLIFCLITNVGWSQEMNAFTLIGFAMLACLAGLFIFIGSDNRLTLPWFYPFLALFAGVSAIIWLSVLASEITALVEAIGFTLAVPRLRLGYTAVAWGNSLTDLLVCLSTVQKGHATMAITAILAAPLLNDLIAFGVSIIMVSWKNNSVPILCGDNCPREFKFPLITSLSFISVAVVLLALTVREKTSRIKMWAGLLAALYVTFLIIILFVEKVDAPQKKEAVKL